MDAILKNLNRSGKISANHDVVYPDWISLAADIAKEAEWDATIPMNARVAIQPACLEVAALILGSPRLARNDYKGTVCLSSPIYNKAVSKIFEMVMIHKDLRKPSLEAVALNYDSPQLTQWARNLVAKYEKSQDLSPGEQPLAFIAAFSLLVPHKDNPYPVAPRALKSIISAMKPFAKELESHVEFRQALNSKPVTKEVTVPIKREREADPFILEIEPVSSRAESPPGSDPDLQTEADPEEGTEAFAKKYSRHRTYIVHMYPQLLYSFAVGKCRTILGHDGIFLGNPEDEEGWLAVSVNLV